MYRLIVIERYDMDSVQRSTCYPGSRSVEDQLDDTGYVELYSNFYALRCTRL